MTTLLNTDAPIELRRIGLEAQVLTNMVEALTGFFPDFLQKIKTSFTNSNQALDEETLTVEFSKGEKSVLKEISKYSYMDISELATVVPEGFTSDYLSYLDHLETLVSRMEETLPKVLTPYRTYLSVFLTNKDAKISTRDETRVFNELKKSRDALIEKTNTFFKTGNYTAKTKIRQVVKRNADFQTVFARTNRLLERVNAIKLKDIKGTTNQCAAILDSILEKLEKKTFDNISPEAARNLAEGAFEMAREVEYFAVCYYALRSYFSSVSYTTLRLNNFFQDGE